MKKKTAKQKFLLFHKKYPMGKIFLVTIALIIIFGLISQNSTFSSVAIFIVVVVTLVARWFIWTNIASDVAYILEKNKQFKKAVRKQANKKNPNALFVLPTQKQKFANIVAILTGVALLLTLWDWSLRDVSAIAFIILLVIAIVLRIIWRKDLNKAEASWDNFKPKI